MSSARHRHAVTASELLDSVDRVADRVAKLSDEERLQAAASGAIAQTNRNIEHTIELATAHALTALALAATEPTVLYPPAEEDGPNG